MKFIKPFSKLGKKDANIAGGKGASLGEMAQSGIPVPDGFVVLSGTFDHFLHETDLTQEIEAILKSVDHKAIHTVDAASEKIRGLIENQPVLEDIAKEIEEEFIKLDSEFVAVRSSATAEDGAEHAWAGQLESFLNTNQETLLDNVRKCWGSLFTPRAIFYRFEKELHGTSISVAVVVQKMVQSEVSGIAFSVHPVTEDYNQLIIEAGYGLGEAIVSGSITPDSYVVEKNPRKILDKNIAEQKRAMIKEGKNNNWVMIDREKRELQKLSDSQVLELSELILKIENYYGFPCDIEWAYENGKFYIVQSRPITTLQKKDEQVSISKDVSYKVVRSRKIYPFPGVWNYESETQEETEKLHGARISTVWTNWEDGMFTAIYDEADWERVGKYIAKRMQEDFAYLEKVYQQQKKVGKAAIATSRKIIADDLGEKTEENLIEILEKLKSTWIGYDHVNTPPWFIGGDYYQSNVLDILTEKYKLSAPEIEKIITPPTPSFSHEEEILLYKAALVAKEKENIQKLAEELSEKFYWIPFGYDGPQQNTTGEYINKIQTIAEKDTDEISEHLKMLESLQARTSEAHSHVIDKHRISEADLKHIGQIYVLAEMTDWRKEVTFQIHVAVWVVLSALAKKYKIADHNDLRFVSVEELKNLDHESLLANIKQRKSGLVHITHKSKTEILTGEAAEFLRKKLLTQSQTADILKGKVGSRGKNSVVTGIVKVLMQPSEMGKVNTGDIIVATMTTPEYVPAMRKAIAILTDEGGVTCHAAIVSRELGLPAIIAIGNATKVLKDGDLVEVDANNGIVKIIEN